MPYTSDFFALHVRFAKALNHRFGLSIGEALFRYTPFALHFEQDIFRRDALAASNPLEWAVASYEQRREASIEADSFFGEYRLFGRFYYAVRDGHIIRPHIAPVSGCSPLLSRQSRPTLLADLSRMFGHIRQHHPQADTVVGNSWLYNLPAYRSLYPALFTRNMAVSMEDEFFYLALWGQFYHRDWRIREGAANELLKRVANLDELGNLQRCFPFQILMPKCNIDAFFDFYNQAGSS
jgi:hypothetical protein